ncbi:MAG: hypothetical protein AB7K68_10100 [Bacteriovoracia bacterium]
MESQKKAFTIAGAAILIMACAMVGFYFVKDRTRKTDSDIDLNQKVEAPASGEKSEFVGMYSPQIALEASGKRIVFFQVNRKEDGGYLGSAKVDTIGEAESAFLNCVDVKIDEKDFFLKCVDDKVGVISLNGRWAKGDAGITVDGKVLWSKDGNAFLDQATQFTLAPL